MVIRPSHKLASRPMPSGAGRSLERPDASARSHLSASRGFAARACSTLVDDSCVGETARPRRVRCGTRARQLASLQELRAGHTGLLPRCCATALASLSMNHSAQAESLACTPAVPSPCCPTSWSSPLTSMYRGQSAYGDCTEAAVVPSDGPRDWGRVHAGPALGMSSGAVPAAVLVAAPLGVLASTL